MCDLKAPGLAPGDILEPLNIPEPLSYPRTQIKPSDLPR